MGQNEKWLYLCVTGEIRLKNTQRKTQIQGIKKPKSQDVMSNPKQMAHGSHCSWAALDKY